MIEERRPRPSGWIDDKEGTPARRRGAIPEPPTSIREPTRPASGATYQGHHGRGQETLSARVVVGGDLSWILRGKLRSEQEQYGAGEAHGQRRKGCGPES